MRKVTVLWICVGCLLVGTALIGAGTLSAQGNTPTPDAFSVCGRTVANITRLLIRDYKLKPQSKPGTPNFCKDLEAEANALIEAQLAIPTNAFPAESKIAYAFIDYAARQYVGTMPRDVKFMAVARNTLPDSRMIFVIGDTFAVFVDYTFTTLPESQFDLLPDYREANLLIKPRCDADWCQPAGPKPTASK